MPAEEVRYTLTILYLSRISMKELPFPVQDLSSSYTGLPTASLPTAVRGWSWVTAVPTTRLKLNPAASLEMESGSDTGTVMK